VVVKPARNFWSSVVRGSEASAKFSVRWLVVVKRFLLEGVETPTYPVPTKHNVIQPKQPQHKLTCFDFLPRFLLHGVQTPTYPKPTKHNVIQRNPPQHKPSDMFRLSYAIPSSRCSVKHSYCLRYSYIRSRWILLNTVFRLPATEITWFLSLLRRFFYPRR